jgi:predicted ester cyclase
MRIAALALAAALGVAIADEQPTRDDSMTTADASRRTIEEFVARFNRHDVEGVVASYAPDAFNFGRKAGRDGIRAVTEDIYTRFPDIRFTVEQWIVDGDWVAVRTTYAGTHRGVGRLPVDGGMLIGVPPTDKAFSVLHLHLFRVENGLIKEHWAGRDDIGMMRQLGLLPPAAATMPP